MTVYQTEVDAGWGRVREGWDGLELAQVGLIRSAMEVATSMV